MHLSRTKVMVLSGWAMVVLSIAVLVYLFVITPTYRWPIAYGELLTSNPLGIVSPQWQDGGGGFHSESDTPGGKVELFELTFSYEVGGKRYIGKGTSAQRYPSKIEVRYNPNYPAESILDSGPTPGAVMAAASLGFIGFVVAKVAGAGVASRAK
jgi:hypothetical protein